MFKYIMMRGQFLVMGCLFLFRISETSVSIASDANVHQRDLNDVIRNVLRDLVFETTNTSAGIENRWLSYSCCNLI